MEKLGCDALVLATCGFGASRAMVRQYIQEAADSPYWGHEGDDGEGIRFGMELGAAVADMTAYQGYGALNTEVGVLVNYNLIMEGGIQVNALGERFSNELANISGQGVQVLEQPGGIAWVVWDERRHQNSRWHEYQQLTSLGAVKRGEDAAALAAAICVPEAALAASITATAAGTDSRFGRVFGDYPPLFAPFYAARIPVTLPRPRGVELLTEPAFNALKRQIFELIRGH